MSKHHTATSQPLGKRMCRRETRAADISDDDVASLCDMFASLTLDEDAVFTEYIEGVGCLRWGWIQHGDGWGWWWRPERGWWQG